MPNLIHRQLNQVARIQQGVHSGRLTAEEAQTARTQLRETHQQVAASRVGGMTRDERIGNRQALNASSLSIFQLKHN